MQDLRATCTAKKPEMTLEEHLAWLRWYAANAQQAAQIVLGWHLDGLRLRVGLVRPVGKHEAPDPGNPARLIPTGRDEHGQNWGLLVKDVTR